MEAVVTSVRGPAQIVEATVARPAFVTFTLDGTFTVTISVILCNIARSAAITVTIVAATVADCTAITTVIFTTVTIHDSSAHRFGSTAAAAIAIQLNTSRLVFAPTHGAVQYETIATQILLARIPDLSQFCQHQGTRHYAENKTLVHK
eukprot:923550-Pleurochrysis_carterae.AAC.4